MITRLLEALIDLVGAGSDREQNIILEDLKDPKTNTSQSKIPPGFHIENQEESKEEISKIREKRIKDIAEIRKLIESLPDSKK